MNVTRRCGVRRVHVCVSIKIDETQSLIALAKSLDDAGQRADSDRVVAANRDWQLTCVDNAFSLGCQAFAGFVNLVEILQLFTKPGKRVRTFNRQIASIIYFVAELCDSLRQAGNTNRCRSQMYACHALAITKRHTKNGNGLSRARKIGTFRLSFFDYTRHFTTLWLPFERDFRKCRVRIASVINFSDRKTNPTSSHCSNIYFLAFHPIVKAQDA